MSRVIVLTFLLAGCTSEMFQVAKDIAGPLLKEIAKAAAPELKKMAARKGIEINEAGSICFPVSEALESSLDVNLPGVAIMCIAPEL